MVPRGPECDNGAKCPESQTKHGGGEGVLDPRVLGHDALGSLSYYGGTGGRRYGSYSVQWYGRR